MNKNLILIAAAGWILLPGMYLIAGGLASVGLTVQVSFLIVSPLGVVGLFCWVYALILGVWALVGRRNIARSLVAILMSLPPIVFLVFAFWAGLNGA